MTEITGFIGEIRKAATNGPFRIILLDGGRFTVSRESGRYTVSGITSEGKHTVGGEGDSLVVNPIRVMNAVDVSEYADISLYDTIGSEHRRSFHISIDPREVERIARYAPSYLPSLRYRTTA